MRALVCLLKNVHEEGGPWTTSYNYNFKSHVLFLKKHSTTVISGKTGAIIVSEDRIKAETF